MFRKDEIYFRWCFSDLATACAFAEQFWGQVLQLEDQVTLIANIGFVVLLKPLARRFPPPYQG